MSKNETRVEVVRLQVGTRPPPDAEYVLLIEEDDPNRPSGKRVRAEPNLSVEGTTWPQDMHLSLAEAVESWRGYMTRRKRSGTIFTRDDSSGVE